jgi:hypothetical protein
MLRSVVWHKLTDVSEVFTVSIVRAMRPWTKVGISTALSVLPDHRKTQTKQENKIWFTKTLEEARRTGETVSCQISRHAKRGPSEIT